MANKYQHYYAKIKDIYLELPDFSYFHSPSGRFRDNPKMVGRKRIKRKLYGLLTNAETKTGSYIITGFRGVGKTSLVNQVINQLQPRGILFSQSLSVIFTWLLIHWLRAKFQLDTLFIAGIMPVLVVVFWSNKLLDNLFSRWNRQYHRRQRQKEVDEEKYGEKNKETWGKRAKRIGYRTMNKLTHFPILDKRYYRMSTVSKILYFLIYGLMIELFFGVLTMLFRFNWVELKYLFLSASSGCWAMVKSLYLSKSVYWFDWFSLNLISIALFMVSLVLLSHLFEFGSHRLQKLKGKPRRKKVTWILNLLKQYINHSQKVFVRLSFPQETQDSKDVLKSLVQHMYKYYMGYHGFNIWVSRLLLFTLAVSLSSFIYHFGPVNMAANSLKQTSVFHRVFPSQHPQLTIDDHTEIHALLKKDRVGYLEEYVKLSKVNTNGRSYKEDSVLVHTIGWDYYGYLLYVKVWDFLKPVSNRSIGNNNTLLPKHPDLVFYLFLLITLAIGRVLMRNSGVFGLATNQRVQRMLKGLHERCSAEVGMGRNLTVNAPNYKASRLSFLSYSRSRNLKYPMASARDIENDLIEIFDELDRVPKIFAPPEFVFILDELDKVDPDFGKSEEEKQNDPRVLHSDRVRKKRELVSNIMANMKVFFTTAKAKFIFIAGREMYDASLADSSDRESYLGSIFHDIIYVSSLYKDPFDDHTNRTGKPIDITYLTERYVCRQLIPEGADFPNNLMGYSKYLDQKLNEYRKDDVPVDDMKKKVINIVTVFVNYLAYRSKGSPMNLVKLFEDFAEEFEHKRDDIFDKPNRLIISKDKNPQAFYLTFDFYAQYRISLVSGIFRPLAMDAGIYLKRYSDKILVSTSYLLDHIYKFHEFGFSWRNLELLPEIIDINRAPLLRRHIENIIRFLSDSHVKRIENGFVNFKFHRKVIEEINFLSRNSDTESALFNFTLDESNLIKDHYRKRLEQLTSTFKPYEPNENKFVNSIAFLEAILGDLHFFDKEYDEAIIYYSDAVQSLRHIKRTLTLNEALIFTRTQLKEALVYERMNTYEPALVRYAELTDIIRKNGKILMETGLRDRDVRRYGEKRASEIHGEDTEDRSGFHFAKSMYENFSIMLLPILAKLVAIEKISKQGITMKDSRRADRDFHQVLNFLKKDEKYLLKVEYHLQKGNILFYKNGVLYKDYGVAKKVPEIYGHSHKPHRDFNAPYSAYEEYMTGMALMLKKLNYNFDRSLEVDDDGIDNPPVGQSPSINVDIKEFMVFTRQLSDKLRSGSSFGFEKRMILSLIDFLRFEDYAVSKLNVTHNSWNLMARLLSALGDCLLIICDRPNLEVFEKNCAKAFEPLSDEIREDIRNNRIQSRTELAITAYGCSAICYSRANEARNSAFQNKKILFLIKSFYRYLLPDNCMNEGVKSGSEHIARQISNAVGDKIIKALNKNRRFIIFPEHSRSSDLNVVDTSEKANVVTQMIRYYRFSYNTEVKMTMLHWFDLYYSEIFPERFSKLFSTPKKEEEYLSFLSKLPLNTYSSVNDQMVRIFELRFKSRLNRKLILGLVHDRAQATSNYRNLCSKLEGKMAECVDQELYELTFNPKELCPIVKADRERLEFVKYLIFDAMFCEQKIIESISLNNVSYIKGYQYMAAAYLSLGWWTEVYHHLFPCQTEDREEDMVRKQLREILGSYELHYIDNPEYAYQQSLSHYYDCINMHSEGDPYQFHLSNMYFTEGDFNDDNQHFCAAIERWLINHQVIRRRIMFIKDKLSKSIFTAHEDAFEEGGVFDQTMV